MSCELHRQFRCTGVRAYEAYTYSATRVGSTADRRIVDHLVQNDDDDALFEELEKELDDDFDMAGIRERRIEELKRE